jgi:hypothetical protein
VQPQSPGNNVPGHVGKTPLLRTSLSPEPTNASAARTPSWTVSIPVALSPPSATAMAEHSFDHTFTGPGPQLVAPHRQPGARISAPHSDRELDVAEHAAGFL